MTNLKVTFSATAKQDLFNLAEYLSMTFIPQVASQVTNAVLDSLERLAVYPKLGRSAADIVPGGLGYFYYKTQRQTVFYQCQPNALIILKIYDNRSDIGTQIERFFKMDN